MEKHKLKEEEKVKLKRLNRGVRDKRSGDRINAILMLDKGYTSLEILLQPIHSYHFTEIECRRVQVY